MGRAQVPWIAGLLVFGDSGAELRILVEGPHDLQVATKLVGEWCVDVVVGRVSVLWIVRDRVRSQVRGRQGDDGPDALQARGRVAGNDFFSGLSEASLPLAR
jgi:hypothetical protein